LRTANDSFTLSSWPGCRIAKLSTLSSSLVSTCTSSSTNFSETMAKRKKTKLTAEFWRKDAEQRANAGRILEIRRKEREAKRGAA
jgi:ubiquinone biosynthesis protein COQ9